MSQPYSLGYIEYAMSQHYCFGYIEYAMSQPYSLGYIRICNVTALLFKLCKNMQCHSPTL